MGKKKAAPSKPASKGGKADGTKNVPSAPKASVALSASHRKQVLTILEDLSHELDASGESSGKQLSDKKVLKLFESLYDKLSDYGFTQDQIQLVLKSLPEDSLSVDAALDWLCMNIPATELPRGFASASVAGSDAEVRIVRRAAAVAASLQQSDATWEDAAEPAVIDPPVVVAERKPVKRTAEEETAHKAWILQNYGGGDNSDGEGSGAASSESEFDDWELWADPREVQRRRAERARAKIPAAVRKQQVAEEWFQTKQGAAAAKASGDKVKQKEAGLLIRQLKEEMLTLGMSEEDAAKLAEQAHPTPKKPAPAAPPKHNPTPDITHCNDGLTAITLDATPTAQPVSTVHPPLQLSDPTDADQDAVVITEEDASGVMDFSLFGDGGNDTLISQPLSGAATAANGVAGQDGTFLEVAGSTEGGAVANGEEDVMNFDLFDMEDTTVQSVPSTAPATPAQPGAPERIEAWGSYSSGMGGKAGKKGGRAAVPPPQETQRMPKAVLQQLCQRMQWNPPRFDRSPIKGPSGGPCYSVTLDPGVIRGAAKKKSLLKGPRVFQMVGEENDWSNIQDAQNAAALWALYQLQSEQGLQHVLPPMWRDCWMRWDANKANIAATSAEVQQASKQELLQSLLAEKQKQQQEEGPAGTGAAAPAAGAEGPQADKDEGFSWESQAESAPEKLVLSEAAKRRGQQLRLKQERWADSAEGQKWNKKRLQLPIAAIREAVLDSLQQHDVVVVSGDTGCGKTTQVPHYLLEDAIANGFGGVCNIVCTQPRRLAAISVAERVANERGEGDPGRPGCLVGYHVRLDAATSRDTQLLFCTTGILLRRLAGDPMLKGVSHIVVDEVHERSLQTDFLMALLKDLVRLRAKKGDRLKVVLMSATLDARRFSEYFMDCPVLNAEGRTFPVQHFFLEDAYEATSYLLASDAQAAVRYRGARGLNQYKKQAGGNRSQQHLLKSGWGDDEADMGPLNPDYDPAMYTGYSDNTRLSLSRVDESVIDFDLLQELVSHIDETEPAGAILVFLPGMAEINNIYERLSSTRRFAQGGHWILPLHSTVSPTEQHKVFDVPPEGTRKIVLATNIAETSLTIEDVVYVVDTGKHKERRYDPQRKMSMLVEDWVARASALQRKGRAGRVKPGMCFGLYTRHRFDNKMRAYGVPEISRVPLEELVLQIHLMKLGQSGVFLSRLLEPPSVKAVSAAVETLQSVGALTVDAGVEQLTPLGQHLALLPLDPRLGKLLVLGSLLGCLGPAATIAASLSYKSPFSAKFDQQDLIQASRAQLVAAGANTLAAGQQSDHLLLVSAYNLWRGALQTSGRTAGNKVAQRHMMSVQTLQALAEMRGQFAAMLADIRLLSVPPEQLAKRAPPGQEPAWVDDHRATWNKFANDPAMVKSVLCGALAPNVAELSNVGAEGKKASWQDSKGEELYIHPSSVVSSLSTNAIRDNHVVFLEKVKTSRVFMRECTVIGPMALLLFGGPLTVLHDQGAIVVDGWLRIKATAQTGVLVKKLRAALDAALQEKITKPQVPLNEKVMSLVAQLVAADSNTMM